MAKTEKCRHLGPTGCLAPSREDCPKKRLPRNATILCYHIPVVIPKWGFNVSIAIPISPVSLSSPRGSAMEMRLIVWLDAQLKTKWMENQTGNTPGPVGLKWEKNYERNYTYAGQSRSNRWRRFWRGIHRSMVCPTCKNNILRTWPDSEEKKDHIHA